VTLNSLLCAVTGTQPGGGHVAIGNFSTAITAWRRGIAEQRRYELDKY